MEPTLLKWSEMAWFLEPPDQMSVYLGEAGNPSYHLDGQVSAMRVGDQVLVESPTHYRPEKRLHIIPANVVLSHFGEGMDGKTLAEVMEENVHYTYNLRTVVQ